MKSIKLRAIRKIDYLIMAVFAIIWAALYVLLRNHFSIMILMTISVLTFVTLLVRRIIIPFTMMIVASILASILLSISGIIVNTKILLSFVILAAVFEILIVAARRLMDTRVWLMTLVGTLSCTVMPWFLAFVIKQDIIGGVMSLINSTIVYAIIGFAGGMFGYTAWYLIRNKKTILRIMHKE